jgi:hypothetical protein
MLCSKNTGLRTKPEPFLPLDYFWNMNTSLLIQIHGVLAILLLALLPLTMLVLILKKPISALLSLGCTLTAHLQLLLGLSLYFVGTNGYLLFKTGEAMSNPQYRFYAVEHISTMIIAIVLFTIARAKTKRSQGGEKWKAPVMLYALGFILLLSRVPWDRWPFGM